MKIKLPVWLIFVLVCPLIAGFYGILHDQLTYAISPEYFTKFKFGEFGLWEEIKYSPRIGTILVGWMATWWTGIPIGLILGLTGMIYTDRRKAIQITWRSVMLTIGITFVTGLVGLIMGWLYFSKQNFDWIVPEEVENKANFITVGTIHTFSYIGGIIGLIAGIIFQIRTKKRQIIDNKTDFIDQWPAQ